MSPPIHPKPCENLPQEIYLYRKGGDEAIGLIGRTPEHTQPLSLDTLTNTSHSVGEMRRLQDQGDGFCSYKLMTLDRDPLRVPLHDKFSPFFKWKPNLFGHPGNLSVSKDDTYLRSIVRSVIYDASSQLFYGWDFYRKNWFSIGTRDNFLLFQEGIKTFVQKLLDLWQEDPLNFFDLVKIKLNGSRMVFKQSRANQSRQLSSPGERWNMSEGTAWIDTFLAWLEDFDPVLWEKVRNKVAYPSLESRFIKIGGEDGTVFKRIDIHGRHIPKSGEIYLFPKTIDLIVAGNYLSAASVLAHEQIHWENNFMGVAKPAMMMSYRGVVLFLSQVLGDNMSRAVFSDLSGRQLFLRLYRKYSDISFEEEAVALMGSSAYFTARSENEEEADFNLRQEALFYSMWEALGENFSPSIVELAGQYYDLMQSTRQVP